jgi:tetratricopeptide (TPR) repeat protein
VVIVTLCLLMSSAQFFSAYLAKRGDPSGWRAARILDPWNASYANLQGDYALFAGNLQLGMKMLNKAAMLNPNDPSYQLDLSIAELSAGHVAKSQEDLEKAIADDPKSPKLAWRAANLFWAQNRNADALEELSVVLANKGDLAPGALKTAWQIRPDAAVLLAHVIPPDSESISGFMELLMSEKNEAGAALAWSKLLALGQQIEPRYLLEYTQFQLDQEDVATARRAWSEAAVAAGLAKYQPASDNLVVNQGFEFPPLNGGFDWRYERSPGVEISLDSSQSHSGNRSLCLSFDSSGLPHIGVAQLVSVQPNSDYNFEVFYKTEKLQAAAAPQFSVRDAYVDRLYFSGAQMSDADQWSAVQGTFHVADTQLIAIRIEMPSVRAIRGRLWIDDVRLTPVNAISARQSQ